MKWMCFVIALMCAFTPARAAEDPLTPVAAQLASALGRSGSVKVAVLAFPHHDNRTSDGPILVCERFTTLLSRQKNVMVVERNHVVQVLDENSLSETGQLEPSTAQLMGKILGVDVLVLGTLINLKNNKTEVNVRGVRADTGRVVAAARTQIERTWQGRSVLSW